MKFGSSQCHSALPEAYYTLSNRLLALRMCDCVPHFSHCVCATVCLASRARESASANADS
jgi:hypothetical protein